MQLLEIVQSIREHSRQMVRELNMLGVTFRDTGLTHSEIHVLIEVRLHSVITAGELSDRLNMDKSTISRIVQNLQNQKLITINKASHDARQKNLKITPSGMKKIQHIDRMADTQVADACELMDETELEIVVKGLQLYAKALWQRRHSEMYIIRPILRDDNPFMAKIIRQVMTEYGAVGKGYSIQDKEVDRMYESFANKQSAYFVITRHELITGGGGIAPLVGGAKNICELKKMYFMPELRGLGLGKKLLRLCLKTAKELGYKQCYLETLNRMTEANRLYQKFGFEPLQSPMGSTGHFKCDAWYIRNL
ncbi:MarR family winged helix-turn-helix transcriptional regulator [bacterium]|nr:MarR family winged helix-turn-helix transcriptional regulator [bacterium]